MRCRERAGDDEVGLSGVGGVGGNYPAREGERGGDRAQAVGVMGAAGRERDRRSGTVFLVVQVCSVNVSVWHLMLLCGEFLFLNG